MFFVITKWIILGIVILLGLYLVSVYIFNIRANEKEPLGKRFWIMVLFECLLFLAFVFFKKIC